MIVNSLVVALILAESVAAILPSSHADCDYPAYVDEQPVNDETVRVSGDTEATIRATAPAGTTETVVYLEILGKRWQVGSVLSGPGEWSKPIKVNDYADLGVGLYRVVWQSLDARGEVFCEGKGFLEVEGSLLTSWAGRGAVGALAVGLVGLTFTLKTTVFEGGRWVLKVVTGGEIKRSDDGRRWRFSPTASCKQTLVGTATGVLLATGSLTAMQQAAITLPTIQLALQLVVPVTILGFVLGALRRA